MGNKFLVVEKIKDDYTGSHVIGDIVESDGVSLPYHFLPVDEIHKHSSWIKYDYVISAANIGELLKDSKFEINDKEQCKAIQRVALDNGAYWNDSGDKLISEVFDHLFIHGDGSMTYSRGLTSENVDYFNGVNKKLINTESFLKYFGENGKANSGEKQVSEKQSDIAVTEEVSGTIEHTIKSLQSTIEENRKEINAIAEKQRILKRSVRELVKIKRGYLKSNS